MGVSFILKDDKSKKASNQPNIETSLDSNYEDKPSQLTTPRVWSSIEYNLPVGTVVGSEMDSENPEKNWLSIQQPDGKMKMVYDIDSRVWNAITKNDIIE